MLEVIDIKHSYVDGSRERSILKGINFKFEKGKVYTIEGPSGSGKTTFLSIIAGLDLPTSGKLMFSDREIKNDLISYRKKDSSIVFQSYNLINYMTSLENVVSAMEIAGIKNRKKIALDALSSVGFDSAKNSRLVSKLSGGEQQRVAIARCFATNPSIVLADEPTGNLDNQTELEIIDLFKNMAVKENKCVIIVTHSKVVSSIADVRIKLKNGLFVVE